MKKELAVIFGLFMFVIAFVIFGSGFSSAGLMNSNKTTSATTSAITKKQAEVHIRDLVVTADIAATAADRKKGLSKRESIPISAGMLFVFDKPSQYGIWMKDMKFAIDIFWLDENSKIVDIAKNVAPEPGKSDRELRVYTPQASAKYVLETNAGLSDLHHLQIGDTVSFEL